jgi:hypothetical protein
MRRFPSTGGLLTSRPYRGWDIEGRFLRRGRLMAGMRREGDGCAAPSSLRWLSDRQASARGSPPEPASGSPAAEHSEGGRRGLSSLGSAQRRPPGLQSAAFGCHEETRTRHSQWLAGGVLATRPLPARPGPILTPWRGILRGDLLLEGARRWPMPA